MRRQSALVYLIFGAIVVIFAFNFGPGSATCLPQRAPPALAQVEGDPLGQAQFMLAYRGQVLALGQMAQREGQALDEAMLERLGLRGHVLERLVGVKLLAHDFRSLGLSIDDEDLSSFLDARYGAREVDFPTYRSWVREQHGMSVERFEADAHEQLAAEHMLDILRALSPSSDADAALDYLNDHNQVRVTLVRFDLDRQSARAQPPDAHALAELVAHEHGALEAWWRDAATAYRTPLELQLERWRAPLPDDADEPARQAVLGQLAELKGALEQQASAGSGAGTTSPEAAEAMGWVEASQLPAQAAAELLALAPGGISQPRPGPGEVVLYRVVGRHEAQRRPLAEVEHEVARDLWHERQAARAAKRRASQLIDEVRRGRPLVELTRTQDEPGPLPVRTPLVTLRPHQAELPGLGAHPPLYRALFALPATGDNPKPTLLAEVYRIADSQVVVQIDDRQLPDEGRLASERAALRVQAHGRWQPAFVRDYLAQRRRRADIRWSAEAQAWLDGRGAA